MKRGICFTAVGDKAAAGITGKYERKRACEEMRNEMKEKSRVK